MSRFHKVLILLLLTSFLLMFLDSRRVLEPAKGVVTAVTAPVQYGVYRAKLDVASWFSFLTFWKSGEARIKNLELRNLELVGYRNKAESLERENGGLRKQLGALAKASAPEGRLVPATVLSVGQYGEITNEGFGEGQTVVYLDNLVGRIKQISGKTVFVQLPTDSNSKIPVKVGRASGLASGQFDSSIYLERIAQNEEIKIDDLVVTSGEGGGFEPGLIVGKVASIEGKETDLFKRAKVAPLIDYGNLTTVFVVL